MPETPHAPQKRQKIAGSDDTTQRSQTEEDRVAQRKEPQRAGDAPPSLSYTLPTFYRIGGNLPPPPPRQPARLPERPHPIMSDAQLPLSMYDPADFTGLPTAAAQNPHRRLTRQGLPPAVLAPASKVFTDAVSPYPHVPMFKFFGNVEPAQKAGIQAKAATVLALVVHGGGQRFIARSPEKAAEIKSFIQSLKFLPPPESAASSAPPPGGTTSAQGDDSSMFDDRTEDGELRSRDGSDEPEQMAQPAADQDTVTPVRVFAPVINKLNEKNRFGQPWTYFVDLPPTATLLREYLLWQKVFAIHTTLSLTVYPVLQERQPWTIMVLSGLPEAIDDSLEGRRAVLAEIKRVLWANKFFVYFVARLAAQHWGITGTMAELAKATTDTLDATVVMAEDSANGRATAPAYLITGKPPSENKDEYARWIEYFTAPAVYWVDNIYQLKVNQLAVECKICKDTTHCARDCPLVKVPGWQGPTAMDIYQPAQGTPQGQGGTGAPEPAEQAREIWQETPRRGSPRGGRGGTRGTRGARGGGRTGTRGGRGGQRR